MMARKNLLAGLLGPAAAPGQKTTAPRPAKGAVGAVGQAVADLKSRSVIEVSADLIDTGGLKDRLDEDARGIAALAESIRTYGQQVPVLLRHSPHAGGRYEVVYGRRRVAALRLAGLPVKAMVRDLNDRDLMIAQGQENAARKDLSFIEKANFARQMRDGGFERAVICDALAIDKTVVSRMLTVADAVPLALLHAIGAAPGIGRDRWLALVDRIAGRDVATLVPLAAGATSDERFEAMFRATAPARGPRADPPVLLGAGGAALGTISRSGRQTVLTLATDAGFDRWLVDNIADIHRRFLEQGGDSDRQP